MTASSHNKAPPLPRPSDNADIAFRMGQIDALARFVLGSQTHYLPEMRTSLGMRTLSRAWAQYREDRAITLGPALVGAECAAERNAFLALLSHALPDRNDPLGQAIATARRIAIRPLADEARDSDAIVAASLPDLDAVLAVVAQPALPRDPLLRLAATVERFRYSTGSNGDVLSATALTPCWAINLAATARGSAFGLCVAPLPLPGLVQRRLFRADRSAEDREAALRESALDALRHAAEDILDIARASEAFGSAFGGLRSNSRAYPAWLLLHALGALSPAQLARALPATKAGAGKLLRQLEETGLARSQGSFAPFLSARTFRTAFPGWRANAAE